METRTHHARQVAGDREGTPLCGCAPELLGRVVSDRRQLAEALACVTSLSADTWRSIVGDVVDLRVERDAVCVGDLALPARRVPVTRS